MHVCGLQLDDIDHFSDIRAGERHRAMWMLHEAFGHLGCSDRDIEHLLRLVVDVELFFRHHSTNLR
jgi:hypothetical protein